MLDENLRALVAHEMYHIRVSRRYPQAADKSAEANRKGGEAYRRDRVELAARLFELKFLEERDKKDFGERLGSFLARLDKIQEIKDFKR